MVARLLEAGADVGARDEVGGEGALANRGREGALRPGLCAVCRLLAVGAGVYVGARDEVGAGGKRSAAGAGVGVLRESCTWPEAGVEVGQRDGGTIADRVG